jgi:hypothetical protein
MPTGGLVHKAQHLSTRLYSMQKNVVVANYVEAEIEFKKEQIQLADYRGQIAS